MTHSHSHDIDFKQAFTVERLPQSQVKITGELPFAELEKERRAAISYLGTNIELDGFRKGHVPEQVLVGKVGEMAILNEMANRALSHHYRHIIEAHELAVVGQPSVEITKLAAGNPLGLTITVAVLPEVTLPDYKSIAKEQNAKKESIEVTDEELETQIKDIMRQKVAYERLQEKAQEKAADEEKTKDFGHATELPTPESETAKQDKAPEEEAEPELPELTEEYVQGLGQPGQFTSVEDFKQKLRQHLEMQKQQEVTSKHRAKITDAIIEKTEMELPQVLVDSELNQMFAQMEDDLKRANLEMEDYLGHIKKTKEDLIKEWSPSAEKRAKLQLVLNEIAKREDVKPDPGQLDQQVDQLMEQHKDADRTRVALYVASVMANESVMQFLEQQ